MRQRLVFRVRLLCGVCIVCALLLGTRLYFVQIVDGAMYARDAQGQYSEAAPDTQTRGTIFFTTKDGALVPAALMQTGWRVAITPNAIGDAQTLYDALTALTPVDHDRFFASAAKVDDPYEEVAFRVSDAAAQEIRAKKLPGVLLVQDQWRSYPAGELASQILGFVAYQGDTKVGVYGLERQWQTTLSETTSGTYINPFAEIFANVQAALAPDPSTQAGSIITTIEPTVQAQLEKTLDGVMQSYTPKLSGGIVMDPTTGEIVAMAARPDFDPNTYNTVTDPSVYQNPLVAGRYELGSIMKSLTMAAGLDSGAVTTVTTYDDKGCIHPSGKTVCNYDLKARGVIPMQEILSQSLNVGASFVADTTGYPTFTRYMRSYGFDRKTGIDLPGEVSGDLSPLDEGSGPPVNYDTASFGQGISVSPIEMARALSALGNGGLLPNPHVVSAVRLESGITKKIPVAEDTRVLSTTTSETISRMLTTVFDKALLGGTLKMAHYSIAAKTGTAQIAIPGGGYYTDRYLHSFFGYFPAQSPRFIIFLFAVEPHGVEYASASLAHPFDGLAKFLINYYDISPDR
jgi:cell division protein FtsI/penicillin-binding protein 2